MILLYKFLTGAQLVLVSLCVSVFSLLIIPFFCIFDIVNIIYYTAVSDRKLISNNRFYLLPILKIKKTYLNIMPTLLKLYE